MTTKTQQLVKIALSQLGVAESTAHDNTGEAIRKYQAATALHGQGWPWCAGFVDWCVKEWLQLMAATGAPQPMHRPKITFENRPVTARAYGLIDWARELGLPVLHTEAGNTPHPGDVVVYNFSHCGIVTGCPAGSILSAVEGNTNPRGGRDGYAVSLRARSFNLVKALIRLCVFVALAVAPAVHAGPRAKSKPLKTAPGTESIVHNVSLAWDASPPGENVAFYRCHFGTSPRTYGAPIDVPPGQTQFTVTGIAPGIYFFAVTAVNADGLSSDFSNEVTTTLSDRPSPPTNLHFGIGPTVYLQSSPDSQHWDTILAALIATDSQRRFYRCVLKGETP